MKREHDGKRGTFIVKVLYGQNDTWQGTVTWVDRDKEQNFRSALELIKMIDSALSDEDKEYLQKKEFDN